MNQKELSALIKNTAPDTDGYITLRDLTLDTRSEWAARTNSRLKFINVNFNAPVLGTFWTKPEFDGCVFSSCDLDGINAAKVTFTDTLFERTSMGKKLFNSFSKTLFRNCEFRGSFIGSTEFNKVTFENVHFIDTNVQKINFTECTFENVTFTGTVKTVNFTGCTTRNTDLSKAFITDSVLISGPGQDMKLPDVPGNFVAYPQAFRDVLRDMKDKLTPATYTELNSVVDFVSGSVHGEIVDPELFYSIHGKERELILEKLFEYRNHK
ncbi:MAG: pentapeptide repeat-containing protein [Bacteroidia bacterium]|nr:pentapeptide repeat-containing protein [Bacteroidia bacterium]